MTGHQPGIYRLRGTIRNYDWGGTNFLSDLLSYPNQFRRPMAEYWLGTHVLAPSYLITTKGDVALDKFIEEQPGLILGNTVTKKFGRLPYLLKLLDVKDMLSVQVHPAKHVAEVEFAKENKQAIPLDAIHRNYKDDNHKPELAVALNDFWLLHGFKPISQLRAMLQAISEFQPLLSIFDEAGYDQLYKTVMEMPQASVDEILQPVLNRIIPSYENGQLKKDDENFWAARAALTFNRDNNTDRGIFSIYFLNLTCLSKGEGLFQDAGVPHAYLEGQNVEIMANSDNVLRGGLTTKHVDVKELMKNMKFEETIPRVIRPQKTDGEEVYRTAAPDFRLSRFKLRKNDSSSFLTATGEILIILDGEILINGNNDQLELKKGEAAFLIAHQQILLTAVSDVDLFRASVPVHAGE